MLWLFHCYVLQLHEVYSGKVIAIDIKAIWNSYFQALYVSPSGENGIIVVPAEELNEFKHLGPGLHKISLITAAAIKAIGRQTSFGLNNLWAKTASAERIVKIQATFLNNQDYIIELEKPPLLAPFTLGDLQGAFYFLLLFLFISLIAFVCELFVGRNLN